MLMKPTPRRLSQAIALAVAPVLLAGCASTLRVAPHAELKVYDPVWTTAYITRNHGYLVYDTLFALDENLEPKPQMVDTWTVSADRKTWTFTLRAGLKWHDGTDVTAEDCVASLLRWSKRDGAGQMLFADVERIEATDARSFTMQLRQPHGTVLETLSKMSANVPFMMPKRVAQTDPFSPVTDMTGSGPYKYSRWQSQPFYKTVYVRNKDYVPRSEPLSGAAGNKAGKSDRIEWLYYDSEEAIAADMLINRVDYFESPSYRLLPRLEGQKNVVVNTTDPLGNIGMMRFNTQQPPFNNPGVRRAVLMLVSQQDYMAAALGDTKYWRECLSVFPCGTALSNSAGSDRMKPAGVDAARKALTEAGYDGTPVVIMNPVDSPVISAFSRVTADKLRQIGMKVEVQDMPWATLTQRRISRDPVQQGGWSMFHTWWLAGDLTDPLAIAYSGDPVNGWFGWLDDPELEKLRTAFARAATPAERKTIAEQVQQRVVASASVGILGQFFEPVAYSPRVRGITSPIQFYWNMWAESPFSAQSGQGQ